MEEDKDQSSAYEAVYRLRKEDENWIAVLDCCLLCSSATRYHDFTPWCVWTCLERTWGWTDLKDPKVREHYLPGCRELKEAGILKLASGSLSGEPYYRFVDYFGVDTALHEILYSNIKK